MKRGASSQRRNNEPDKSSMIRFISHKLLWSL